MIDVDGQNQKIYYDEPLLNESKEQRDYLAQWTDIWKKRTAG